MTQVTVEPGANLPVDSGQAIRVFVIERGTLTFEVAERSRKLIALAEGTAAPVVRASGTTFAATAGDRLVTDPRANYGLKNTGQIPAIMFVVIVSNTLEGGSPLNNSSAAASWTVASMPEALGGVLPSPAGISARVLADGVELDMPEESTLALGWIFLASGATFVLPAGNQSVVGAVLEGSADLASISDGSAAHLASGEWMVVPPEGACLWQAGANGPTVVLLLAVG